MNHRCVWRRWALLLLLPLFAAAAQAQPDEWPSRTIKIVSPFPPGGTTDLLARLFAPPLSRALGQSVIVENRAGGGGSIGTGVVAKSPPDGYTALFGGNTEVVVAPALGMPIRYDPIKDLTPVAQFTLGFPVMVVNSTMGVKTLAELIEWAKARPGQLTCGTSGHGSGQHFICELLARSAKIQVRSVPYKGTGPMLLDVASSQIHVAIGFLAEVDKQYIVPGKVIPVGTLGPRRLPRFPNLPTMNEMGHTGFEMLSWTGLFVPGGTPKAAITRLNAEITKVVREPEFATWLAETGSEVVTPTPEEFASFTRGELERWRKMSQDFGIKYEP